MSETKNELVEVQIESVEGEYLTGREYIDLKVQHYKEEAERQRQIVDGLMAKHKKTNKDIVKARLSALRPWI
jgi:hypothetical protein